MPSRTASTAGRLRIAHVVGRRCRPARRPLTCAAIIAAIGGAAALCADQAERLGGAALDQRIGDRSARSISAGAAAASPIRPMANAAICRTSGSAPLQHRRQRGHRLRQLHAADGQRAIGGGCAPPDPPAASADRRRRRAAAARLRAAGSSASSARRPSAAASASTTRRAALGPQLRQRDQADEGQRQRASGHRLRWRSVAFSTRSRGRC